MCSRLNTGEPHAAHPTKPTQTRLRAALGTGSPTRQRASQNPATGQGARTPVPQGPATRDRFAPQRMAVVSRTPATEVEPTSKGEHHAPCHSFGARSPSLQRGRANRSAAKYLALCPLITAWTRAKFSSPSCLVVAVAVQQRGLAGGPHRFEFRIVALAKRVRPPLLAAFFMSAHANSLLSSEQ